MSHQEHPACWRCRYHVYRQHILRRARDPQLETCCTCGEETKSGIYVPDELKSDQDRCLTEEEEDRSTPSEYFY